MPGWFRAGVPVADGFQSGHYGITRQRAVNGGGSTAINTSTENLFRAVIGPSPSDGGGDGGGDSVLVAVAKFREVKLPLALLSPVAG